MLLLLQRVTHLLPSPENTMPKVTARHCYIHGARNVQAPLRTPLTWNRNADAAYVCTLVTAYTHVTALAVYKAS